MQAMGLHPALETREDFPLTPSVCLISSCPWLAAPPPHSALKLKGRAAPGEEVLLGEALDCVGSMKGGVVWKVRRSERPGQEIAPWAPMQACFWPPLPSFSAFLRD